MLLMIGLWIAMQNTEQLIWGGVAKLIPSPFSQQPLVFGPVSVSPLKIFVLIDRSHPADRLSLPDQSHPAWPCHALDISGS